MPIYVYNCVKCGERFDHLARTMSSTADDQGVKCPACGAADTKRALSVFAVGAEGTKSSEAPPGCGRCGGAPGSCQMG